MKIEKPESIWMDGRLIPWDEAQVHVFTHALHYASSVFEGLRAYATPRGPAVVELQRHVRRLFHSCRVMDMPLEFSEEQICEGIVDTVRSNAHESCYIRPLVFRGYGRIGVDPSEVPVHVVVGTLPHGGHFGSDAKEKGIDVGVSSWRRMAPDTLPAMVKAAGNYVNSQLALLEAHRHGYKDNVVLDVDGYAAESHGANLFVISEGTIYTPPLGDSILGGVTRACLLQIAQDLEIPVVQQRIAREMLAMADEIFLTGTAAEVTPVRSVEKKPVGSGARGPITERVQREYLGIVSGQLEDRHGWLTHVS